MTYRTLPNHDVSALQSFSVGVIDGTDPMMVLEYENSPIDPSGSIRERVLIAMTLEQAKELAGGLLMAVKAAEMQRSPPKNSH